MSNEAPPPLGPENSEPSQPIEAVVVPPPPTEPLQAPGMSEANSPATPPEAEAPEASHETTADIKEGFAIAWNGLGASIQTSRLKRHEKRLEKVEHKLAATSANTALMKDGRAKHIPGEKNPHRPQTKREIAKMIRAERKFDKARQAATTEYLLRESAGLPQQPRTLNLKERDKLDNVVRPHEQKDDAKLRHLEGLRDVKDVSHREMAVILNEYVESKPSVRSRPGREQSVDRKLAKRIRNGIVEARTTQNEVVKGFDWAIGASERGSRRRTRLQRKVTRLDQSAGKFMQRRIAAKDRLEQRGRE